ncbi:DUF6445 family protein [Streptosporangium canum]|uniref:DUF6445 family protein n=1 Tax=Streptosporangium canum TaxID=324952 RepID=UPI003448606F
MHKAIHVVDGFYTDPWAVRDLALRKGAWLPPNVVDGVNYGQETGNSFFTTGIARRFETLIGRPIVYDPARMGFGGFSMYGEEARVDFTTHFDETDWSAICYLVPDDDCTGGLAFFRHRETGFLGPPDDEQAVKAGFAGADDFMTGRYFPDRHVAGAWEKLDEFPMRFNRLILLRGSRLFHRASAGFGSRPDNGRLTQRFFFNEERNQG